MLEDVPFDFQEDARLAAELVAVHEKKPVSVMSYLTPACKVRYYLAWQDHSVNPPTPWTRMWYLTTVEPPMPTFATAAEKFEYLHGHPPTHWMAGHSGNPSGI